jgi:formylglycine-generating enzyme required for sulfatase activity
MATCGPNRDESCCTSLPVDGGMYLRSYDGVSNHDPSSPATVSAFALDKYEVTVGRFRRFVDAWDHGWVPRGVGAGVHTHLNTGKGLVDSSGDGGTYEPGWRSGWNVSLPLAPATSVDWKLYCDPKATWTTSPDANEDLPINCVDWYRAYAFCIWDGGFLPSEAEWDYAAAGGGGADGQRVYAWSSPPTSPTIDCTHANYQPCGGAPLAVGASIQGAGKWGQLDLTGNVWEWTLDYKAAYVTPCTDCAYLAVPGATAGRTLRGASWDYPANNSYVANRDGLDPTIGYSNDGIRCARAAP